MLKYLNDHGQLTDEAISLYVDAMRLDRVEELPEALQTHVEESLPCHQKILDLYTALEDVPVDPLEDHPFLDQIEAPKPAVATEGASNTEQLPAGENPFVANKWNRVLLIAMLAAMSLYVVKLYQDGGFTEDAFRPKGKTEQVVKPSEPKVDQSLEQSVPPQTDQTQEQEAIEPAETPTEPTQGKSTQPKGIDPDPSPEPQYIAADFSTADHFEDMMGTTFRSEVKVEINTPTVDQSFALGQAVQFNWTQTQTKNLMLNVYNNKEQVVFGTNTRNNQPVSWMAQKPGLYYWQLETEDDILHTGKFLVK